MRETEKERNRERERDREKERERVCVRESACVCVIFSLSFSLSLSLSLFLSLPVSPTLSRAIMSGMRWLQAVDSLRIWVSFAEYRLFYRALLQQRPIFLGSLLIVAAPYANLFRLYVMTKSDQARANWFFRSLSLKRPPKENHASTHIYISHTYTHILSLSLSHSLESHIYSYTSTHIYIHIPIVTTKIYTFYIYSKIHIPIVITKIYTFYIYSYIYTYTYRHNKNI